MVSVVKTVLRSNKSIGSVSSISRVTSFLTITFRHGLGMEASECISGNGAT